MYDYLYIYLLLINALKMEIVDPPIYHHLYDLSLSHTKGVLNLANNQLTDTLTNSTLNVNKPGELLCTYYLYSFIYFP